MLSVVDAVIAMLNAVAINLGRTSYAPEQTRWIEIPADVYVFTNLFLESGSMRWEHKAKRFIFQFPLEREVVKLKWLYFISLFLLAFWRT